MPAKKSTSKPKRPGNKKASGGRPSPCYASFWGKLLRKWDWWIYCRAVHSLRRMTLDNPGMSYLMELNIRGWNEQLEISPELKRSTEVFHDAMRDHRHNVPAMAAADDKTPPKEMTP